MPFSSKSWLPAIVVFALLSGGRGASAQTPGDASAIYLYKGADREARLLAARPMN